MERLGIKGDERTGLIVALALHLAFLAVLVTQALLEAQQMPPRPERMVVSLAEEVGLEATAPEPVPDSRAAVAPELADMPKPAPEILEAPSKPIVDRTTPRTEPQPRPERPRRQPDARPKEQPKGSRIGDNFLAGSGSSTDTNETRAPAATFGRSERAALSSAITRALRPHWSVPSGVDSELLVSVVAWRLNPDGSPVCTPLVEGGVAIGDFKGGSEFGDVF